MTEPLDVEDHEAHEGHADRDVHVARWRPQEIDLADRRHEPDPVVEQDQQEEPDEDRDVRAGGRSGEADPEVAAGTRRPSRRCSGARPGISFPPRVIRTAPTSTMAITIHMVRSVELMLGWIVTRSVAAGADSGARSSTVCTAGNSRLLSMKQAGNEQASPGAPSLGNGGTRMYAATIDGDDRHDKEQPAVARRPLRRRGAVWGFDDRVGHDLLARHALLHTQERGSTPRSRPR